MYMFYTATFTTICRVLCFSYPPQNGSSISLIYVNDKHFCSQNRLASNEQATLFSTSEYYDDEDDKETQSRVNFFRI